VRPLAFTIDDRAGLGLGYSLFGFFGAFLAEGALIPVGGKALVDDDLRLVLQAGAIVDFGVYQSQRYLSHAGGLAIAGAGEDNIFHLYAAETLGRLFTQDPCDGI
jgi:hypothetical protein